MENIIHKNNVDCVVIPLPKWNCTLKLAGILTISLSFKGEDVWGIFDGHFKDHLCIYFYISLTIFALGFIFNTYRIQTVFKNSVTNN